MEQVWLQLSKSQVRRLVAPKSPMVTAGLRCPPLQQRTRTQISRDLTEAQLLMGTAYAFFEPFILPERCNQVDHCENRNAEAEPAGQRKADLGRQTRWCTACCAKSSARATVSIDPKNMLNARSVVRGLTRLLPLGIRPANRSPWLARPQKESGWCCRRTQLPRLL